ncbi:MAG: adenylate kinase family protein [Methanobrevibacter sp.]|nr:adenylate kinase family protein [Methanobrevibacter sp.]
MPNSLNELNNLVIFISGTPCTGKTTISTKLNEFLISNGFNTRFIKINDFAIEKDLVLGEDPDKFYKVIDIDKLNEVLNEEIDNFLKEGHMGDSQDKPSKIVIVEGHLSHLCEGADKMIVLRLHPSELEKRLKERNYSDSKIKENLEAEALAVCSAEAYETYGENASEIDTTIKSMDEVLELIINIMSGDLNSPVGSIDFMDWFLN